jgi:circadian clock protein KaiB
VAQRTTFLLRLFVSGHTASTDAIIVALRETCGCDLRVDYELEVVDLLVTPEAAEQHNIVVTPTLVRAFPLPACRKSGDVATRDTLLELLHSS